MIRVALFLLMAPFPAFGGGFFDGVPARGCVREDVALEVLAVSDRGASAVAFTRRSGEPVLLEAGGHSVRFYEADLGRPTVRCWLHALVARADPAILEAAAGVRLIREATGGPGLGDDFDPARVLSLVTDPLPVQPRGAVTVRKGPFTGEPWDRLSRDALQELGRP